MRERVRVVPGERGGGGGEAVGDAWAGAEVDGVSISPAARLLGAAGLLNPVAKKFSEPGRRGRGWYFRKPAWRRVDHPGVTAQARPPPASDLCPLLREARRIANRLFCRPTGQEPAIGCFFLPG